MAYLQDATTLRLTYVKKNSGSHQKQGNTEVRKPGLSKHDVRIHKIYRWTDSSKVLQLLQAAHKKQQVIVELRAARYCKIASMDQWRHIKVVEKTANIGTREISNQGVQDSRIRINKTRTSYQCCSHRISGIQLKSPNSEHCQILQRNLQTPNIVKFSPFTA